MNEIYTTIALVLRDAGLPASTYIVERYLSRNDFQGLISLLQQFQEAGAAGPAAYAYSKVSC